MSDDQQMGRGSMVGQVDYIRDFAGLFETADYADGLGGDGLLRLIGRSADVVRAVYVLQFHNFVCEIAGRAFRLIGEDVQSGAYAFGFDGLFQSVLINDFGARCVDQIRPRQHRLEDIGVNDAARVWRERDVNAQDVAIVRDLDDRLSI